MIGVLHEGRPEAEDVDEAVDEIFAGGGSSHPEETSSWLPGPAQTALLSF